MSHDETIHIPGISHANFRAYVIGFALSIILTAIPFGLVIYGLDAGMSHVIVLTGIALAATVQVLVHLHYFLHLDRSSEQSWNVQAILFTALIIVIMILGTLWIMFDLQGRMM
ncbi:cytochrome o ubiquinol oxidase subunit IV [Acidihalobacter ferrooxydans]|uniref:Cytochrome bo(3) ubiquinol oxidase subunit 4 n=1 Tax=Acidihalobacter ferrooxydans TaxID=1765967 RepID=A0A1P8UHR7_9GAMM|nr:cytochrome o ubiquinol oxidase subunit IV [Acidihalobacter ferrooxydans]APZ43334.1 cytochrome o ubiquinol oxidase subunit IV [Acidihalobacter ferrooxydans]